MLDDRSLSRTLVFFLISSQFFRHFTLLSDTKIAPVLYSLFPHDAFKVSAASGAFSGPLCVCLCGCSGWWCLQGVGV